MTELSVEECMIMRMIRNLPQLRHFCCTYIPLRYGVILIGWTGFVLSVFLTVATALTTSEKGVCTLTDCTALLGAVNDDLRTVKPSIGKIPLNFVIGTFICIFGLISATSVDLLYGVYQENWKIVRLWLQINAVAWAIIADLHLINLITLLSRDMGFVHVLVRGTSTSSLVALYFYCIVVVKSYYIKMAPVLKDEEVETYEETSGFIGFLLRKIPQIEYICCKMFALRSGALAVGYAGIIVLFLLNSQSIIDLINKVFSSNIPTDLPNIEGTTQKWSLLAFVADLLSTTLSYAMSVLLLIGVYKKKMKLIEVLLIAHVVMWASALVFSVICYAVAPAFNLPPWNYSFSALFGISILLALDFYCIVVIKSYYVQQFIRLGKNKEQAAENIDSP